MSKMGLSIKLSKDAKARIKARMRQASDEFLDPGREPDPPLNRALGITPPDPLFYASNVFLVMKEEYERVVPPEKSPDFIRNNLINKVCENTIFALNDATAAWEMTPTLEESTELRRQIRERLESDLQYESDRESALSPEVSSIDGPDPNRRFGRPRSSENPKLFTKLRAHFSGGQKTQVDFATRANLTERTIRHVMKTGKASAATWNSIAEALDAKHT